MFVVAGDSGGDGGYLAAGSVRKASHSCIYNFCTKPINYRNIHFRS